MSGELVALASKKVNVKDKSGNSFQVSVDDPRYQSGELTFSGGPSKGFKYERVACPHCGKIGGKQNMRRWHFANCSSTPHKV